MPYLPRIVPWQGDKNALLVCVSVEVNSRALLNLSEPEQDSLLSSSANHITPTRDYPSKNSYFYCIIYQTLIHSYSTGILECVVLVP